VDLIAVAAAKQRDHQTTGGRNSAASLAGPSERSRHARKSIRSWSVSPDNVGPPARRRSALTRQSRISGLALAFQR